MKKKGEKVRNKEPGKRGRKDAWTTLDIPSKLESIRGWAMNGSTDEDIYTMLGIGRDTFYKWKREKSEFSEALKRGKDIANGELLNSAFKQSVGYSFYEEVPVKVKRTDYDPETGKKIEEREEIKIVKILRESAPNPTMNIFMLKNRLPDQYKDKHEIEGNLTITKLEDIL
jgi:hypothetical protein